MKDKSHTIRLLLEELVAAHGVDAFPVEDWRPDSPDMVTFTSTHDRRFAGSVIALAVEPPRYSVIVELYDPPEPSIMPFEIAADGTFSLPEVVALFGCYRDWSRAGE